VGARRHEFDIANRNSHHLNPLRQWQAEWLRQILQEADAAPADRRGTTPARSQAKTRTDRGVLEPLESDVVVRDRRRIWVQLLQENQVGLE
jgi:hypothetical protein